MAKHAHVKKLRLTVVIEATDTHCSNSCQYMNLQADRCLLFKQDLTWDKKRRYNGNFRVFECRQVEKNLITHEVAHD